MIETKLLPDSDWDRKRFETFVKRAWGNTEPIYYWFRTDSWKTNPPVIAQDESGFIAGFHSGQYNSKGPYINSLYIAVSPEAKGQGIGGRLIGAALDCALRTHQTRIKFKCKPTSGGDAFWQGFGARPYAIAPDGTSWYDMFIGEARTVHAMMELWKTPEGYDSVPEKEIGKAWMANARIL